MRHVIVVIRIHLVVCIELLFRIVTKPIDKVLINRWVQGNGDCGKVGCIERCLTRAAHHTFTMHQHIMEFDQWDMWVAVLAKDTHTVCTRVMILAIQGSFMDKGSLGDITPAFFTNHTPGMVWNPPDDQPTGGGADG